MKHLYLLAAVLTLVGTLSLTLGYMNLSDRICQERCGEDMSDCPHRTGIPLESLFGFGASGLLFWIYFTRETKRFVLPKGLDANERKILEFISQKGGAVIQSELVSEFGFSKAKVSRLVDKLELKGLVERRRRGLVNLVVLKPVSN